MDYFDATDSLREQEQLIKAHAILEDGPRYRLPVYAYALAAGSAILAIAGWVIL